MKLSKTYSGDELRSALHYLAIYVPETLEEPRRAWGDERYPAPEIVYEGGWRVRADERTLKLIDRAVQTDREYHRMMDYDRWLEREYTALRKEMSSLAPRVKSRRSSRSAKALEAV